MPRKHHDPFDHVRRPAPPPRYGSLPHALTFFLTADERSAVLSALRPFAADRAAALLRALGIDHGTQERGARHD